MDSLVILGVMGAVTAFNFTIIISKYRRERYFDATIDMLLMGIICFFFSSGINALSIGMISSFLISMYLWFRPLYLFGKPITDEEYEYE